MVLVGWLFKVQSASARGTLACPRGGIAPARSVGDLGAGGPGGRRSAADVGPGGWLIGDGVDASEDCRASACNGANGDCFGVAAATAHAAAKVATPGCLAEMVVAGVTGTSPDRTVVRAATPGSSPRPATAGTAVTVRTAPRASAAAMVARAATQADYTATAVPAVAAARVAAGWTGSHRRRAVERPRVPRTFSARPACPTRRTSSTTPSPAIRAVVARTVPRVPTSPAATAERGRASRASWLHPTSSVSAAPVGTAATARAAAWAVTAVTPDWHGGLRPMPRCSVVVVAMAAWAASVPEVGTAAQAAPSTSGRTSVSPDRAEPVATAVPARPVRPGLWAATAAPAAAADH